MNRRDNNKGLALYEEVLQKNFEIIESFMNKFPVIFKKHEVFEQNFKKINEKLAFHELEIQKNKDDNTLSYAHLEKKILLLKENSAKQSHRTSIIKPTHENTHEEKGRKSSFRMISNFRDNSGKNLDAPHFSIEKEELMNEMNNKQKEITTKIEAAKDEILSLKEKINFLSIITNRVSENLDIVIEQSVKKELFTNFTSQLEHKCDQFILQNVQQKYKLGNRLIEQSFSEIRFDLSKSIGTKFDEINKNLTELVQKKKSSLEANDQFEQIKNVIQKIVVESIESFASKEETKQALILFEKKVQRIQTILQSSLAENYQHSKSVIGLDIKSINHSTVTSTNFLKQKIAKINGNYANKTDVMSGFGLKKLY